jgi:hypothetical protein
MIGGIRKRVGSSVNALLLVGLLGLLLANLVVVGDLPARVYTAAQMEFLNYNLRRDVLQTAPVYNVVSAEGDVSTTILPVEASRVEAILIAEYEEKEGVSVTVYDLRFQGEYQLSYSGPGPATTVELFFPFPSNLETLHDVRFIVDGEEPVDAQYSTQEISWLTMLETGEQHVVEISYKADGATSFTYALPRERRADIDVTVQISGLQGSQVPSSSLPPTSTEMPAGGEVLEWGYTNLIANRDIRVDLPRRLSFAQRVAQLEDDFRFLAAIAPFVVGLFLFSLAAVLRPTGVRLQMHNYLLVGCGLALFYPGLTFLSGLVPVGLAAVFALLPVSGMLLAFLASTVGWRQTLWRVGPLLVIFLGLLSLGMLTPWRGLFLTVGGLALVGTYMLLYSQNSTEEEAESVPDSSSEPVLVQTSAGVERQPEPERHCLYCGRELLDEYRFCPGCASNAQSFKRCEQCSHEQFLPPDLEQVHCTHCGEPLT